MTMISTLKWTGNAKIGKLRLLISNLIISELHELFTAHRVGWICDVHIYRFVSQFTVEEAILQKANLKQSLDDLVIQRANFKAGDHYSRIKLIVVHCSINLLFEKKYDDWG
jgi:hypothetical protein